MGYVIALDVETADQHHTRICSIGFCRIEEGQVIDVRSQLIDPECEIDPGNARVHGIHDEDVAGEPNFKQFWDEHAALFLGADALIAHNASFDLSVLGKTLQAYGVLRLDVSFIDTLEVARWCFPGLPGYGLDVIAKHLKIALDHHDAGSDARACAEIYCKALGMGFQVDELKRVFHFPKPSREEGGRYHTRFSQETLSLQELIEWVQDRLSYGYIDDDDLIELRDWISDHQDLTKQFPCNLIAQSLDQFRNKPLPEAEDYTELQNVWQICVNPVVPRPENRHLIFKENAFCLSGDFHLGNKKEIEKLIIAKGGQVKENVTKNVKYLIIGSEGSKDWRLGNYGKKIQDALKNQMKGIDQRIICESDFEIALQNADQD